jgi:glycopeptide antibiotics resistance protein
MSQQPPPSHARRNISLLLLLAYAGVVAAMTLSPTPLDQGFESSIDKLLGVLHRNGVPEWFGYDKLEFTANIMMFIPLGFLLGLALPARIWWLALLASPAISIAIEMTQAGLLTERFATPSDVFANTIGGLFGTLIAVVLRAVVNARDEMVVARALWKAQQPGPVPRY